MHSATHHRRSIRRLAPLVLASVLLSISPVFTTAAYALDSISGVLAAGETLSTGAEATLTDPTATSVTVPVAGLVTITEGAVTQTAPSGREFFGQEIDITAPVALTILDPIKMVFRFDASVVPAGSTAGRIRMFRNGTELPACTGAAGTASPDPCTSNVSIHPTTGDLEIVAFTSAASRWNAGRHKATDGGGSVTASPGSVVASSVGNNLTFAFTASTGGMDGQIQMTIPSGWSAPQNTDATGAGYVSVAPGTCSAAPGTVLISVAARVVTLDMLCSIDQSLSIGYANASAPATFADHEFTTKTKLDGGTFTSIAVQPKVSTAAGALSRFEFSSIGTMTAGSASTTQVTAKDALGNTITAYSGTPVVGHDLGASATGCGAGGASACSPSANLGSFSSGIATLSATAYKAEIGRTFTITDGSVTAESSAFAVAPAGAARLSLLAPPDAAVGSSFTATVTALDTYGNVATGYRGTVAFSSTDAYASLPAGHAFSAADSGTRAFTITFGTAGVQSVTAQDAAAGLTATDSVSVGDAIVPTVTISGISPSLVRSGGSATVSWSSDERGTFSVRVGGTSCSGGTVLASGSYSSGPGSTSIDASALAEGANTVRVCVTDSGANTGAATGTVTKDSIAPDAAVTSGPSGTINATSVGFAFSSPDRDATLSCRMTDGAGTVVFTSNACAGGTKTYDIGGLVDGPYVFEVTATDPAGNSGATPATRSFTLDRSIPQTDRVVAELGAGGTASTGTQPSAWDVVVTSVRVPSAGSVTIEETAISLSEPLGWDLFGQQVNISATAATSFDDPLRLVFRVSLTALPAGYEPGDVTIFRDGSSVPSCSALPSDPCFTSTVGAESLEVTVLTTRPSEWNFGVRMAAPSNVDPGPSVPVPVPSPSDGEPPQVTWSQRGRYISPNGDGRRDDMTLSATFSEPTSWTLSLALAGDGVEPTAERSVSSSGSGTEIHATWSGLTAGRDAPDGTYVWKLVGEDAVGNLADPVSGVVVVDRTSPVISAMGIQPGALSPKGRVTIGFEVGEAAKVRVKIFHWGSVVKRFQRRTLEEAGTVSLRWRGRDDTGRLLPSGRYRVVIKAVDAAANRVVNSALRLKVL